MATSKNSNQAKPGETKPAAPTESKAEAEAAAKAQAEAAEKAEAAAKVEAEAAEKAEAAAKVEAEAAAKVEAADIEPSGYIYGTDFIDQHKNKVRNGDDVPKGLYDDQAMAHYKHHGMIVEVPTNDADE